MRVYLINPRFEPTLWSFEGLQPFTGTKFLSPPLGLATVAALTPKHWDIQIVDENIDDVIDYNAQADLIGITAFNVQYQRSLEIAEKFRSRGIPVAVGGPYCSLFPEAYEGKCDYRLQGEAEFIWPEFLRDFEAGKAKGFYSAVDKKADLTKSPIPRYDLIKTDAYNLLTLQTSRGCPFSCEFCDIIIMDGRVPRTKTVEQVLAEVDHCVKQGSHYILFGDANFIGNIPYARKLLKALAEYQKANHYPVELCCELTINVAHYDDLLELMQEANFYSVFIGIESPRAASLVECKKAQNTRRSMFEDIARIHSYHISVMAGIIVGFDSDDKYIFQEQFEYLTALGVAFTTCGTLMALPNTPLLKRLEAEGRLLDTSWAELNGHGAADCNFTPKQMSFEELHQGYNWLIRCLYRYDTYSDRLVTALNRFQNRNKEHLRAPLDLKFMSLLFKVIGYYLFNFDPKRIKFFTSSFWRVATGSPFSVGKWLEYFRWIATYRAFRKYVIETHGFPEGVDPKKPPFIRPAIFPVSEVLEEELIPELEEISESTSIV
ncbi:MAG: DUF4070 domain-containing protein [Candidatus Omnitrophica bacterium]|nr:DUF4070 domain-containing protein [Candidatus Omnitrophota bacterium]